MKAWILPAYDGIESMSLATLPDPTPAPDEIILQLHFAALNPADNYLAIHQYPAKPTFPHILGRDGIGTVIALGSNVSNIHLGETRLILRSDVGVNRHGTLAEKVAVEARTTVPLPEGWSLQQAAAAPLVYVTAWQALTQWPEFSQLAKQNPQREQGPILLITGASGGVGVASIQLAKALGFQIAALSRGTKKTEALQQLGATWVLDPTNPLWPAQLKKQLDTSQDSPLQTQNSPRRVNLAIDNIGGELFNQLLDVMALHGRISVVGRLAGPVPSFNTSALLFRRIQIGGVAIGAYTHDQSLQAWQSLLQLLQQTHQKPLVDSTFPFDQTLQAFARLAEGPMGKVLVQITP